MSEVWVEVLAAFAAGLGSLAAAWISVTISKRRAKKDCDARVDEVKKAVSLGARLKNRNNENS